MLEERDGSDESWSIRHSQALSAQTDRRWEYDRLAALFPDVLRRRMERDGWTWVSTWYPFLYFKREAGPLA